MATRKKPTPIETIVETVQEVEIAPIEPPKEAETTEVKEVEKFSKPLPVKEKEPEIINCFYEAIGLKYCHKCGEPKRTNNNSEVFCPAAKDNCSGLVD
jgi:hypothetical protein